VNSSSFAKSIKLQRNQTKQLKKGEKKMYDMTIILEEKERKLAHYLEASTTEEVLIEVQKHIPAFHSQLNIFKKLKDMKLPHSVINTLIYYVLATKKKLVPNKLLKLADLCRKYNIKTSQAAITFFKHYHHLYRTEVYTVG
jgi:replication initiation and membrane attachment protein DnaB